MRGSELNYKFYRPADILLLLFNAVASELLHCDGFTIRYEQN